MVLVQPVIPASEPESSEKDKRFLDAGSVIQDLIRSRHDSWVVPSVDSKPALVKTP